MEDTNILDEIKSAVEHVVDEVLHHDHQTAMAPEAPAADPAPAPTLTETPATQEAGTGVDKPVDTVDNGVTFDVPADWTPDRVALEFKIPLDVLNRYNGGELKGTIKIPEKVSYRNGMELSDEVISFNGLQGVKIPVGTVLYI